LEELLLLVGKVVVGAILGHTGDHKQGAREGRGHVQEEIEVQRRQEKEMKR
jgi:hypothetical protein